MHDHSWISIGTYAADVAITIGLSIRVIMRRRPVGVALAWIMLIAVVPFAGAAIYLTFGELRLGNRRARRAATIHDLYEEWLENLRRRSKVDWATCHPNSEPLSRLAQNAAGISALAGNAYRLLDDWHAILDSIVADIDAANSTCHMVFYIWSAGGKADDVAAALIRAAGRGVKCRVLVDAVGSRQFLVSQTAQLMRDGGVELRDALPGGLLRMPFLRFDLRLHRKIVVIDGEIAYTGSLNMVDPRYFKQDARVGQWVDAMIRVTGPAVEPLAITFLEDWQIETDEELESLIKTGDVRRPEPCGEVPMQVIPSGPAIRNDAIQQILLMTIYSAQRELILTTPYFVPDESMVVALISAARRGVEVTLVVPQRTDSVMIRFASQSFKGDLLASGVRVAQFTGGLLHTKSISVDGEISLIGSLNLDPRSMYLNFEITIAVFDAGFTAELRDLQLRYIGQSEMMDLEKWRSRSIVTKFAENVARLLGPLL